LYTGLAGADEPTFYAVGDNNTNSEAISKDENVFYSTGLTIPTHLLESEYSVSNTKETYPSKWDWRDHDGVTPVKNQGKCGSCYAFSAVGALEHFAKTKNGVTLDLSEEQAKNCVWNSGGCIGGTVIGVISIFTQNGVMSEADFPYYPINGLCQNIEPIIRITEWKMISTEKIPSKNTIKKYIMENGGVSTSVIVEGWGDYGYNGSYVLSSPNDGSKNHAVVIVGWNDSISDNNVSGHWIFKNSWSEQWGDKGYGYIDYQNGSIGQHASVISEYENYDPTKHTINYDEAGWTGSIGATGFDRIRALCKYNVSGNVTGIEFWTTGATSDIDLYLYDGFSNLVLGNELGSVKNLCYDEPGYHSIQLPVDVYSPTGIVVVVAEIENIDCVHFDDKVAPIAVDFNSDRESEKTYVSVGDPTSKWYDKWYDMSKLKLETGDVVGADVALRLRATGSDTQKCKYIILLTKDSHPFVVVGDIVEFIASCVDEYGCKTDYTDFVYKSSNETVGKMNGSKLETFASGTTTVTVFGGNNVESNGVEITVYSEKTYLTEKEFDDRVQGVNVDLDEFCANNSARIMNIATILNNLEYSGGGGSGSGGTYLPRDMVSREKFNTEMDNLQEKIKEMNNKSMTLYELILNIISRVFG